MMTGQHNDPPFDDDNDPLYPETGGLLRRLRRDRQNDPPQAGSSNPFTVEDVEGIDLSRLRAESAELLAGDPDEALNKLEEKMARVTEDFTEGRLNQAQFQAMYTHYTEQRALILKLKARDPDSDAWMRAAKEGYTTILRRKHKAQVLSIALFDNWEGSLVYTFGDFDLPDEILTSLLGNLSKEAQSAGIHRPHRTQIEGGRWLVYVGGDYCTTVAVYSKEPSMVQMIGLTQSMIEFETINEEILEFGHYDPAELSFPQEALLE